MKYTPEERKLLSEGDYDFVVEDAKERTSKKGTDMIEIKLKVTDGKGNSTVMYDNLMSWNLPEFQIATGETVEYGHEVEVEAYDFVHTSGRLHLFIEEYNGTSRNKVSKYLPAANPKPKVTVNEDGEPDGIPF